MLSLREGFLFSEKVAFGQGSAGAECSINACLNTSGDGHFSPFRGGEYSELRVA